MVDPDKLQDIHNEAQKIGSEGGTWNYFAGPWKGAFESDDDYEERREAWEAGMKNGLENQPEP